MLPFLTVARLLVATALRQQMRTGGGTDDEQSNAGKDNPPNYSDSVSSEPVSDDLPIDDNTATLPSQTSAAVDKMRGSGNNRVEPRAMAATSSPHPRAQQEQRFTKLAKEWHSWVVVPEYIGGVPITKELLDSGVYPPKKHCFWQGCHWAGSDNASRWKLIRNAHWSIVRGY